MSQPIRLFQVATGNLGSEMIGRIQRHPDLELVGLHCYTADKIGRDAGEIVGGDPIGVIATGTVEEIIAARPDVLTFHGVFPDEDLYVKVLEAGIDVVGSAPGTLQYPWGAAPDRVIEKVEAAAQAGGASLYITGVDPGFASDLLPLALASTCQRIEQVRCYELADYATYDGAEVMFDLMGFGKPIDTVPMLFLPGVLALAWGTAIRMMAAGLGIEVDEIVEHWEVEPAPESYDIAAGRIEQGTIAAMKFSISGMVDGPPAVVVEHVTRTREDLRPDWAHPAAGGAAARRRRRRLLQ